MLGRYTTGPVAARAEHSRGASRRCRLRSAPGERRARPDPAHAILAAHGPRIDLRSDTVTHPTPAMRRAMAEAEVGDDVFGDDPTVNALEERAAELLGKEAGLFVASGTMGNLVAQMAHLARGQETIAGREHHLVIDEAAGHAVIVGASIRALEDRPDGTMDLGRDRRAPFRDPTDPHEPISGLDHHREHPRPLDGPAADAGLHPRRSPTSPTRHGVPLHIDGARFWNAVVAQGVRPTDLAGPADSVTFCLSKGARLPGRLGRRRSARLHLARAPRPQDGRWRDAPGRHPRRGRAGRPVATARTA